MSEIANIPHEVLLNNGSIMPRVGLGTWALHEGDEVRDAVGEALRGGYRLIDTASMYGNESGIGEAIASSDVPRDEIFVTTKVWETDQGYRPTIDAFAGSLGRLGMRDIDLYLIHWPRPGKAIYTETWKAMLDLYAMGQAHAIGVSNFEPGQIDDLLEVTDGRVVPAVNQIELHPYNQQAATREYCTKRGIHVQSWSPLGRGEVLADPVINDIATSHGRTAAQVILRWQLQSNLSVIPKSSKPDRQRSNLQIYDFALTDEDMERIRALDRQPA